MHPLAGKPAPKEILINTKKLIDDFFDIAPDPSNPAQAVSFGTSGHRGSSTNGTYNQNHVLAITQAVCEFRKLKGITGPLFMGIDTHALSAPSQDVALEVLMANEVETLIAANKNFTPTPGISHAILCYNEKSNRKADGIVITPSHNPPDDGGFKYNPPHGGPAGTEETAWIEKRANEILKNKLIDVKRSSQKNSLKEYDYITPYVDDLKNIIDFSKMKNLNIGVDPMGGSNIAYWVPIAQKYGLRLEVVNKKVDPTFSFMCVDKDGKIRMDCSSASAMASLISLKDKYDIAFGNDADSDRHGIVTPSMGLMNPNHYLAVAIQYLFKTRTQWPSSTKIGKTLVSSSLIDRVAKKINRSICEVPVGFKWFVDGLLDGSFGFGGEESAGASFLRLNGKVWTTDKDGIIMDLLAAEITANTGKDPGQHYQELIKELGQPFYSRKDSPIAGPKKDKLKKIKASDVHSETLGGEKISAILSNAPGNNAPIGGLKIVAPNGWFAARPSGTEDVYKIYAESFISPDHLKRLEQEAQEIVNSVIG